MGGADEFLDQLPASFLRGNDVQAPQSSDADARLILEQELDLSRLHSILRFLWLTGRPVPPRPLHYQVLLQRDIAVSERIDTHLVWGQGRVFLKPIPRFLLNPRFWRRHLACERCCDMSTPPAGAGGFEGSMGPMSAASTMQTIHDHGEKRTSGLSVSNITNGTTTRDAAGTGCHHIPLRQAALGFLLSYTALLPHESDFDLAWQRGLVPSELTFRKWRIFVREILSSAAHWAPSTGTPTGFGPPGEEDFVVGNSAASIYAAVAPRFIYGELRLNRLNMIHFFLRFLLPSSSSSRSGPVPPGPLLAADDVVSKPRPNPPGFFLAGFKSYSEFCTRNLGAIIAGTAYIILVLSAMQVGTGVAALADNPVFQRVTFGFTIFSILGPVAGGGLVFVVLAVLFVWNLVRTRRFERRRGEEMGLGRGWRGEVAGRGAM